MLVIVSLVTVAWSVRHSSVCMSSVTLVHRAKAVGRNEMPFDRDTPVVTSNVILHRGLGLHRKGTFGVGTPPFVAMPPNSKSLCPLLVICILKDVLYNKLGFEWRSLNFRRSESTQMEMQSLIGNIFSGIF